jgi:hypothetical protein
MLIHIEFLKIGHASLIPKVIFNSIGSRSYRTLKRSLCPKPDMRFAGTTMRIPDGRHQADVTAAKRRERNRINLCSRAPPRDGPSPYRYDLHIGTG